MNAPADAFCGAHGLPANAICERCGAFVCAQCAVPHCAARDDASQRIDLYAIASLLIALSTICCYLAPGPWLLLPHGLALGAGGVSIQLAREQKLPISAVAVLGLMLSTLGVLGDIAMAVARYGLPRAP